MNELVYKIFLGALVVTMNIIRLYYRRRYKTSHAVTEVTVAPKREKQMTLLMSCALAVPGMMWLFTDWLSFGQFSLPDSIRIVGFAIGIWSIWWFYRIHRTLGDNWSPVLEIRREHTLITDGPYRYVRHPMYTDMLLWLVSFVLVTANWFYALTISAGLILLFTVRIPDEERLMLDRFGEQYRVYMKRTKRLIPHIF
ncbi:MAG: isoprenylcysteine carboxylmethyltransferase family protein [Bacteroidales bacterium]|jgi:protein-S-isoprenylcysteine O-methyltransferase Ste14|nr:isoprenylcysteine carboxylmethyltransferase family protein [Bacteroidales bacterium]